MGRPGGEKITKQFFCVAVVLAVTLVIYLWLVQICCVCRSALFYIWKHLFSFCHQMNNTVILTKSLFTTRWSTTKKQRRAKAARSRISQKPRSTHTQKKKKKKTERKKESEKNARQLNLHLAPIDWAQGCMGMTERGKHNAISHKK